MVCMVWYFYIDIRKENAPSLAPRTGLPPNPSVLFSPISAFASILLAAAFLLAMDDESSKHIPDSILAQAEQLTKTSSAASSAARYEKKKKREREKYAAKRQTSEKVGKCKGRGGSTDDDNNNKDVSRNSTKAHVQAYHRVYVFHAEGLSNLQ